MSNSRCALWRAWVIVATLNFAAVLNAIGVASPVTNWQAPIIVGYLFIPLTLWFVIGIPLQVALQFFIISYAKQSAIASICTGAPEPLPLPRSEWTRIWVAAIITGLQVISGILYFVWFSGLSIG